MTTSQPGSSPESRTIVIRSPRDAVTAVPCLLGFHPERSLVAIGVGGPHGTCAVRMDLPPPDCPEAEVVTDAEAAAGHLADVLSANGFGTALLVGYGHGQAVGPVIEAARAALSRAAIEVIEALRVEGDRYWSYFCSDPSCCPPEGSQVDFRGSTAAAETVAHGRIILSDRAELARTVAPLGGAARDSMLQATLRAEQRVLDWVEEGLDPQAVRDRMEAEGLSLVRSLAGRTGGADPWPAGDGPREDGPADAGPADDEIAWLGLLLTHLRVRDEAWVHIDRARADAHVGFWRMVLRRVDPGYAAAPGALLGYAAYLSGNGGLANVALDRAEAARPGYTMAGLIRDLMIAGVPPAKAALPMTPEALAETYEGERRRAS